MSKEKLARAAQAAGFAMVNADDLHGLTQAQGAQATGLQADPADVEPAGQTASTGFVFAARSLDVFGFFGRRPLAG